MQAARAGLVGNGCTSGYSAAMPWPSSLPKPGSIQSQSKACRGVRKAAARAGRVAPPPHCPAQAAAPGARPGQALPSPYLPAPCLLCQGRDLPLNAPQTLGYCMPLLLNAPLQASKVLQQREAGRAAELSSTSELGSDRQRGGMRGGCRKAWRPGATDNRLAARLDGCAAAERSSRAWR